MKVLIIMNSTNVKLGGGIIQVILNYKKQLDKENIMQTYAINCIEDSTIPDLLIGKNSNFIQLPNKKNNLIKYFIQLNKIMKKNKFDVVHVHGNSANMLIELGIAKLNKIKCRIAHSHNTKCNHPLFNKVLKPIFKCTYTKALACSTLAGEWLFGQGKFEVLNNVINIKKFEFSEEVRKEYRKKLNIKDSTKVIGHVGNLNEQKNQEYLIRIFKTFCEKNNDSVLIMLGDGHLKKRLMDLTCQLKLQEKVKFLGIKNDVNNWMQAMDIFIFPSRWEGFGMVLIEAQAAGLPIISSNVVPNIVKIEKNMVFMDLEKDSVDKWANKSFEMLKENNNRIIDEKDFCDYDVEIQGKKLLNYYNNR